MNRHIDPAALDATTSTLDVLDETLDAGRDVIEDLAASAARVRRKLPWYLLAVHWFIIVNLVVQCAYGSFQVFYVLQPEGTAGPMFGRAMEIPFELMMARRTYALESWVAFVGLAVYLALTEIVPRRLASEA